MTWFQEPMAVFAVCASLCAAVFWSTRQSWAQGFYKVIPSIVLVYYLPTFASTLGVIPTSSAAYDWMRDYLLPFSLFILMATTDLPTILKVGPKAVAVMVVGTLGIVVGGPLAYLLFKPWLDPDSWKALAALSGSWIGGGGNFAAIKESVGASDSLVGPIIIVDTAVGYTWMGVLLFLANYQDRLDRWLGADSSVLKDLNRRLADFETAHGRHMTLPDATLIIAFGFAAAVFCRFLAGQFHAMTQPVLEATVPSLASIFSEFTWLVILISSLGILLSLTRVREIENAGASKLGYAGLYFFLTSIGAKADLAGILAAPVLLAVGTVWILIHVAFLVAAARLLRAPMFLLAVGSQANVGGAASAPILAAGYYEAMAPVGLLLGILGYLLGNYAGLMCAFLFSVVSGA